MNKAQKKLLDMLTYKRREGSVGQKLFNERFVQPMMGKPDEFGNFICMIAEDGSRQEVSKGTKAPKGMISFMAHHDTVHRSDGRQKVFFDPHTKSAFVDHNECLGADCTTGVWLILEMIRAKVPGIYVVHTGEEVGGIGSSAIVKSRPDWIFGVDVAISFDRYGKNSIITHQMGQRTCSDSFAADLESILNLGLEPDSGGVYTDSYEYCDIISECTNISVGYYNQHTKTEYQDMEFAEKLRLALVKADWTKIRPYRDPTVIEFEDYYNVRGKSYKGGVWSNQPYSSTYVSRFDEEYDYTATDDDNFDRLSARLTTMEKVIEEFPYEIAEILSEYGYNKDGLIRDILNFHNKLL